MEDSFSDFQKKKKIKIGPKVDPKDKNKNKKKTLKRSKGQKDIRSLINKNELASYSQDFEQVCKQSGVDVDSEQLQLAIALSKSMNEFQSSSQDVEIQNRQLSSQERSAKIRTTLQEYGFKVNNSKIILSLSKNKRKKYKKHSKLLQISSEEREQNISNKYIQVLASNICISPNEDPKCSYLNHTLFYKATNIPYDVIKNDDIYYVSNLIDKPTHKTCLLRDWSEIPGRPASPKPMHKDINFETIQYSQDELDSILSGSLDMAQSIVNSKQHANEDQSLIVDPSEVICIKNDTIHTLELTPSCSNSSKYNEVSQISDMHKITEVQVHNIQDSEKYSSIKDKENIESEDLIKDKRSKDCLLKSLKVIDSQSLNSRKFRSLSPDLFDDEVCSIIEDKNDCSTIETTEICSIIEYKNNCNTVETNEACSIIDIKTHNGTRESTSKNDNCATIFMDLTECANNYSNLNIHNIDISKRKSNDLMDITECVKPKSINNTDVIISSGEIIEDNKGEDNVELVDLTQVVNSGPFSPEVDKNCTKISDSFDTEDTVIYDNIVFENTLNENIDLQEPTGLCEDEGIAKNIRKDILNDEKSSECHNNSNDSKQNSYKYDDENDINSQKLIKNVEYEDNNHDDINIDLTQGSAQSEELLDYPEYIYNDSISVSSEHNSGALNNNEKNNDTLSLKSISFDNHIENLDENIDLTQDSEKSIEIAQENYVINCPGTSNTNNRGLENLDHNVAMIDKNNSIISVESIVMNSEPFEENNADKIDLTQLTEEIVSGKPYAHKNNSKLGKIDNISIDYDELFDEIRTESRNLSNQIKNNSNEKDDFNGSNPSMNSEVFEISDKELNYSIHHSIDENINMDFENTGRVSQNRSLSDGCVQTVNLFNHLSPIKEKNNSHPNTPIKINRDIGDAIIQTPKNNEYIIKTREVTPMADYESMTSPERNKELEKYGLKPFKRKRAIQLLTYVYNQTHPVIQNCSPEEGPSKRLKRDNKYSSPKKNSKSPKKCLDFGSDLNKENDIFLVTKETPDIKNIECDPQEWVFQNREKAKVHSCRVPLHIAFHNYVSCRKLLKEAILRYEPVNIDIIHRDLVSYGHKYNPKDLLKFMDRKCITVKTAENNSRNKKV